MVEFMNSYQAPMERQFEEEPISPTIEQDIETPIVPISELGTTVTDHTPGNILQNIESSIRLGTKKIQLVISGGTQGPGQLASSFGKDIRQEVKERAKAAGVEITGVELAPQKVAGLSGWNPQQGMISEEKRMQDLRQVKDAIQFAADVAGGGGVDIWSNEFERDILDAKWNKDKDGNRLFYTYSETELERPEDANVTKFLIDSRDGKIIRDSIVRTGDKIHRIEFETAADKGVVGQYDETLGRNLRPEDYVDIEGKYVDRMQPDQVGRLVPKIDPKTKQFVTKTMGWKDVVSEVDRIRSQNSQWKDLTPEEYLYRERLLGQFTRVSGEASYWARNLEDLNAQQEDLIDFRNYAAREENNMSQEARRKWIEEMILPRFFGDQIPDSRKEKLLEKNPSEVIQDQLLSIQNRLRGQQEQALSYKQSEQELLDVWTNIESSTKYASEKVWDSYAEAGLHAFQVTKERKLEKPVYVGPEIGFAGTSYGGHPDEFIEIVEQSREKLAKQLETEGGLSSHAAKDHAKKHIKGMLDTSHLTMWYKHFAKKPGESEKDHLNRFKKWTKDKVVDMVQKGVVGGVQVVDSFTGEHAHLPVGQGIFDTAEMIRAMKDAGFKGDLISEGHEEEQFGKGRILTETWNAFGSPINSSYTPGGRGGLNTWGGIQSSYFGHTLPTPYVVGGYAPSNDWTLWSETPLE